VESDLLNASCLKYLSGLIKEDILNLALIRGKTKLKLKNLLHKDIKILQTRGTMISEEDVIEISKCEKITVLEINPPKSTRFNHPTNCKYEVL
jgi:hypothetical protein